MTSQTETIERPAEKTAEPPRCQAMHIATFEDGQIESAGVCTVRIAWRYENCSETIMVCQGFREVFLARTRSWTRCPDCDELHWDCVTFTPA